MLRTIPLRAYRKRAEGHERMIEVKQASDGQLFDRPTVDGSNVQAVHDSIPGAILTRQLAPSQELSQVQLAKQPGIRRTPLPEAVPLLARRGLAEYTPRRSGRGAGVSPASRCPA